jgi:hypothetical protein
VDSQRWLPSTGNKVLRVTTSEEEGGRTLLTVEGLALLTAAPGNKVEWFYKPIRRLLEHLFRKCGGVWWISDYGETNEQYTRTYVQRVGDLVPEEPSFAWPIFYWDAFSREPDYEGRRQRVFPDVWSHERLEHAILCDAVVAAAAALGELDAYVEGLSGDCKPIRENGRLEVKDWRDSVHRWFGVSLRPTGDGEYLEVAYARQELATVVSEALHVAIQTIQSDPWYSAHEQQLIWSDEEWEWGWNLRSGSDSDGPSGKP